MSRDSHRWRGYCDAVVRGVEDTARRDPDGPLLVRVLGPVGVSCAVGEVALSAQLRRLLAVLAAADGAPVGADRIADRLGGRSVDGSLVRTAISRLRKVLDTRVETAEAGYRLRFGPGELDAAEFESLCIAARGAATGVRIEQLQRGLGLWRGPAFDEFADEEWARPASVRLNEARAVATEDLAEALIDAGQPGRAVMVLESHVVEHPYRERPVAMLMRALTATGRVADALRAFQRLRVSLREDIGIDPTSELRALESELLGGLDPVRAGPSEIPTSLPDGTVTFLFTDIEGSTERWQADEVAMSRALAEHDATIGDVLALHDGVVFKHTGDGVCAVFTSARSAVDAAVEIQRRITIPIRIGLHTGEAERRGADYFGPTLNRTARVMDAGNGGQILVTAATVALVVGPEYVDQGELRLKGLATPERVFQVGHELFPALRVTREHVGNLPNELTSFIGRTSELAAITAALQDHRVVTLTGVGGTGKTRLAIEAASSLAPTFADGCWFVELAPVATAEALPFAFAAGLGIALPADADPIEIVVSRLRHKRALVVVDNCEHLTTPARDMVQRIAHDCDGVAILSTSREPLLLSGEHLLPVRSLGESDAERLFVERARAEDPELTLDDLQRTAVQALCRQLDDLPLAVELAASRIRSFTPTEIVSLLNDRFHLLVGARQSRTQRHRTLRATLDWSYDLCTSGEQAVFDRLSVFASTFELSDARVVGQGADASELDVIDIVPHLVDRSFLQRTVGSDGKTRYRLLETLRAYGREHLNQRPDAAEVWRQYATHVATTIGRLTVTWIGPDEDRTLDRMSEYVPDALVALEWLIEHQEWNLAARIPTIWLADERPGFQMGMRLHDALRRSGDQPAELRVIEVADVRFSFATTAAQTESEWAALRGGEKVPPDWFAKPAGLEIIPTTTSEAAELVRSLERFSDGPPWTRVGTEHWILRTIVLADVVTEKVPELSQAIDRFDELARSLGSATATSLANELCGVMATSTRGWGEAAYWFGEALKLRDSPHPRAQWYLALTTINEMIARTFAGTIVELAEVFEVWRLLDFGHLKPHMRRAAFATALILYQAGESRLSDRFLFWLYDHEKDGETVSFYREYGWSPTLSRAQPHEIERLANLRLNLQEIADAPHRGGP